MVNLQWSIGNTSVRNPDRLKPALKVLSDSFEGKAWNEDTQKEFFEKLVSEGIYTPEKPLEEYEDWYKSKNGRLWVSALNELGLCASFKSKGEVIIPKVGKALLDENTYDEEIFLRQLLKYQLPNPLPKKSGEAFSKMSILPFILSMKLVHELDGMNKSEMGIFLFTAINMKDIPNVIQEIKKFREEYAKTEGRNKKSEFTFKYHIKKLSSIHIEELKEKYQLIKDIISKPSDSSIKKLAAMGKGAETKRAKEFINNFKNKLKEKNYLTLKELFDVYYLSTKAATLIDYADLNFRYLRMSGIFSTKGNRLVISEEKIDLVTELLKKDFKILPLNEKFFDYFYDPLLPQLPSDNSPFLLKEIDKIESKVIGLSKELKIEFSEIKIKDPKDVNHLKYVYYRYRDEKLKLKEMGYGIELQKDEKIEEIINYFELILNKQLLGGNYPAHLEWNIWRVFLAIDKLANQPFEARNFKIDDDLQPISFATGNQADMVFEYEGFQIVVEATLSTYANQWNMESEPIPRHVAKIQYHSDKKTYSFFIAPKIDVNTAMTFYGKLTTVPYKIGPNKLKLIIIPISIEQLIELLEFFKKTRFKPNQLKILFEKIESLSEDKEIKDGEDWLNKIPSVIENWKKEVKV